MPEGEDLRRESVAGGASSGRKCCRRGRFWEGRVLQKGKVLGGRVLTEGEVLGGESVAGRGRF